MPTAVPDPELQRRLTDILGLSPLVTTVLDAIPGLGLPHSWLAAGVIAQTVWNHAFGFPPSRNIKDIDLVYFDPDTSKARELKTRRRVRKILDGIGTPIDVKNEARVHLWYRSKFGYDIPPYSSVEDAISSFPTTATAIGVRPNSRELSVCAPFGLGDLLGLIVRPNKRQIKRDIYESKIKKWQEFWPELLYVPWDSDERGQVRSMAER